MIGAAIGAVVGIFFGLPGLLLGPFVGAALGEFSARRGMAAAGKAGIGATLGLVIGAAAKLALAFSMIAVFMAARFLGGGVVGWGERSGSHHKQHQGRSC